jgi:aminodeoxyfutalosine synthase
MTPIFDDPRLLPIRDKVERGERLSFDDGVTLYRSPDLLGVGWMANLVRERCTATPPSLM